MTDETKPSETESSSAVSAVIETVGDLLSDATLPAPIRRNALKALDRLCASALEIPASYLEGIAAERRAETLARTRLIAATTEQIASQLKVDPRYAEVAVKKFGNRIVREQVNLDSVAQVAAADLKTPPSASQAQDEATAEAEVTDDWLNTFEKEASQKSSRDMQLLFGRILAGEIRRPSQFSIRTVKLAGELDGGAAKLFLRLCSLSISLRVGSKLLDARTLALGGNAGSNALGAYGLGFDQLNTLHEYGLVIPDYNSYLDYQACVADPERRVALGFTHQGRQWALMPTRERSAGSHLRLHGVALSKAGRELLPILDLEPDDGYFKAMSDYFAQQGLQVVPLTTV